MVSVCKNHCNTVIKKIFSQSRKEKSLLPLHLYVLKSSILMKVQDYSDAFEKLLQLSTPNKLKPIYFVNNLFIVI